MIIVNGQDQSVGGETGKVEAVEDIRARVQRARIRVRVPGEKAVQQVRNPLTLSSTGRNGHQSGCGRLCKRQACDGWESN